MNLAGIISELHSELDHLQQAILSLERFDRPSTGMAEPAAECGTETRAVRGAGADS